MNDNRNRFLRQLDIVAPEKLNFPITVIGAGAIGSSALITLAKMGCQNLTVWDADILEDLNIPNQLCKPSMVGRNKVEAVAELVNELTDVEIKQTHPRYTGQNLEGAVIVTVDNMTCRQNVWKRAKLNCKIPLLIDARMGAEFTRIYTIHPINVDEADFYEENLYFSQEAERLPCSARSIVYCPTIVAGLIALQVKKFAIGEPLKKEILLDLPALVLIA